MVSRVAAESADETERGTGAWRVEGTGTLIRAVGLPVTHSLSVGLSGEDLREDGGEKLELVSAGHSWRGFTLKGKKRCEVAAGGGNGRCFPMR